MLTHLDIENYALIDHLDITFYKGFTAITGETGAGKSILVDALDLVLGKRADLQVLLDPAKKCIVEATFSVRNYGLKSLFEGEGLDYDDMAIIRREIHPNGKSRAFVNDTPVTLTQLKMIGEKLVDIHAQHATTSLQDPDFQLSVIDSYAGLDSQLMAYRLKFLELKDARHSLTDLVKEEENARATLDYKLFLLNELIEAEIDPHEQEQSEEKLTILTHAEEIKNTLFQVQGSLNDDEDSTLNTISQAVNNLGHVAVYHPGLGALVERLNSDLIDLKDICLELSKLNESIEFNPEQLVIIQQRLELLYRLQHKHHVQSNQQLTDTKNRLEEEVGAYASLENQIKELEARIRELEAELENFAVRLTASRSVVFPALEQDIMFSVVKMGMPEAKFEIRHELLPECGFEGRDKIEFYFNANRGHSLKPLAEIASGGELSRVMLSIKSIISHRKLLPTIIFDEIDNGLSGDVAGRVGDVLISTASRLQVIAVTHLPQIAGKAHHHYSVFKHQKNNVTFSNIKFLDRQERVAELAKMIGGREITEASLAAANELLTSTREIH
jgi:DNA repair protein RecN (Recombination protein N)